MGLRLLNQEYGECFFVTTSFHNHIPWGNTPGVYEVLVETINFRTAKTHSHILAYVFMPSHIHFAIFINGKVLSSFIRDFKKFTAQKGFEKYCGKGKVWQDRYDRQAIWSDDVLLTKIEYIHANPVRAGLVANPEDWKWSSAGDYLGHGESPVIIKKDWN